MTAETRRVAVIVLNWNGWANSVRCLTSLVPAVAEGLARIIVIDNGSTDDSILRIRAWFHATGLDVVELREEDVRRDGYGPNGVPYAFVHASRNGGYAAGNNIGIRLALRSPEIEYIFILNNDTIVEPDCVAQLLRFADRDQAMGIIGSTLVEGEGRRIAGGNRYNRLLTTSTPTMAEGSRCEGALDFVTGAAQFIRASALRKVGLLSEDYFLYFEELDLTRRMGRAGFGVCWCPEGIVHHEPGRAAGSRSYLNSKKSALAEYHSNLSCLIFMRKFHPYLLWIAAPLRFALKLFHHFVHKQPTLVVPMFRAYRDYLTWVRARQS